MKTVAMFCCHACAAVSGVCRQCCCSHHSTHVLSMLLVSTSPLPSALLMPSGKLHTLCALLRAITAEGSKVVVVSTSTTALDMIDELLCAPNK